VSPPGRRVISARARHHAAPLRCMSSSSDEQMVVALEGCAVRVVDAERVAAVAAAMPPQSEVAELADVFGLLADPGRLKVLVAFAGGGDMRV
jgi:hypothetical protein